MSKDTREMPHSIGGSSSMGTEMAKPVARALALLVHLVALLTVAGLAPAAAGGRVALLIANQAYQPGVGALKNPIQDVRLVAEALSRIGFAVHTEENVTAEGLRGYVAQHVERVKAAGPGALSFFYYSGHGVAAPARSRASIKGSNFLIPTDLETTRTADFWDRAVPLEEIGRALEAAESASHIVVFDACRTELILPDKDLTKGFVPIANDAFVEMLFAFATAPNTAASDGVGSASHGPYAQALAQELAKPGIDHLHLFANVRTHVVNATQRSQIPWVRDGFLGLVYLSPRNTGGQTAQGREGDQAAFSCPAPETPEAPQLTKIEWSQLSDRRALLFKRPAQTFVAARTDAAWLEQVERGTVHHLRAGTILEVGRIGGKDAWYRYVRSQGSNMKRYISVDDALAR